MICSFFFVLELIDELFDNRITMILSCVQNYFGMFLNYFQNDFELFSDFFRTVFGFLECFRISFKHTTLFLCHSIIRLEEEDYKDEGDDHDEREYL